jgi:RND family efflux transporter MFP subunit
MICEANVKLTTMISSVAIAALAAGCTATPPQSLAVVQTAPVPVTIDRIALTAVPVTFEAGGVVRARLTATIASRVMAPIVEIHVRPGDHVRRGAPLVTLDAREIKANSARAAAAAAAAEDNERAAEADVAAADAALRLARASHRRMSDLFEKQSATAHELDLAIAGLSGAEAQLSGARARAAAAKAGRDAARAQWDAAEIGASYTVLAAPFDGVVTERQIDPGVMATPGAPLLTLEDPARARLDVQIDEARGAHVDIGQAVDVSFGETADADVEWIAARVGEIARIDPASHAFLVKIDLPRDANIRSGRFARARFAGPTRQALTVPASSIIRRGQIAFVFTLDTDETARLRPISVGPSIGDRAEALAGVRAGDVVLTDPPLSLADGMRVTTSPVKATGAGDRR